MTETEALERPGRWRPWRRVLAVLGLLPLAVLLLLCLLQLPPLQQKLGQTIAKRAGIALDAEVKLESLRFNLFAGTVRLSGLRITGTGERAGTAASIDSLSVDASITALMRKRIRIEDVRVEGLGARLLLDEKGAVVLPFRLPPPEEKKDEKGEMPRLAIERLELSGGWLDLQETGGARRHLELKDLRLSAGLALPALDSRGRLSIGEIIVAAAGREPLGETSLSISWDQKGGSGPASAEIEGKKLDLRLAMKARLQDLLSSPAYSAEVDLSGSLDRLGSRLAPDLGLAGKIALRLEASGRGAALSDLSGKAHCESLAIGGRSIERADVTAEAREGRLRRAVLDAQVFGGEAHLEAAATLRPALSDITFKARAEGLDAARLVPPNPKAPGIAGIVSLTAEGALAEPKLESALASAEVRVARRAGIRAGTLSPDIAARLSLGKGNFHLEELRLKDGENSLDGAGTYHLGTSSFDGHLELIASRIGPYLTLVGLEGSGALTANLRGKGTLARPEIEGKLRGRSLSVSGVSVDRIDLDARVDGGRFEVSNGSVSAYGVEAEADADGSIPSEKGAAPELDLRVRGIRYAGQCFPDLHAHAILGKTLRANFETTDGRLRVQATQPPGKGTRGEASFDRVDLGFLGGFLPRQFKGLSGEVTGSASFLQAPAGKFEASVAISSLHVAAAGRRISSPGIDAVLRGSDIEVTRLQLEGDEGTRISLSGRAKLDSKNLALKLAANVPDLASWAAVAPGAPALAGKLSADLELSGSLDRPAAKGSLSARGIEAGGISVASADLLFSPREGADLSARLDVAGIRKGKYEISRVELEASRRGDSVRATGTALGGQVRFDATASLAEPWPFTATVDLASLDAGAYARVAGAPKDFESTVTGSLRASGRLDKPESVEVDANLGELTLRGQGRTFSITEPIRASYSGDRVRVESFKLRGENASMDVSGSLPIKGQSEEKLRIDASLDLKSLLLFVPSLDRARGTVAAELDVASSAEKPRITGRVSLKDGLLDGPSFPAPLEKLEANVSLTPALVRLDGLSAEIAGGPVSLQGSLTLVELSPGKLEASLRVRDVDVEVIRDLQVRSSADIKAEGTYPNIDVKGTLRIDDATYIPALDLTGLMKSLTSRRAARRAEAKSEKGPVQLSFDLAIVAKDAIHLQGNLGEADAGGNLQVKGTPEAPEVLGSLATLPGGSINLLGSKWDLTQARVDFSDPLEIDPDLMIVATTTKSEEEITATIRGQASKAQLLLSSSKGRSQADILTLLVGGSGGSAATSALADAAAGMAVRGAASPLLGSLGKSTDVEIVPLPTSPEGEKFLFSVAKDLGGGLTATYFKGMSGETADAFEMRWRVSSRVKGRVRQNQDGTLSGGFRIRREFN